MPATQTNHPQFQLPIPLHITMQISTGREWYPFSEERPSRKPNTYRHSKKALIYLSVSFLASVTPRATHFAQRKCQHAQACWRHRPVEAMQEVGSIVLHTDSNCGCYGMLQSMCTELHLNTYSGLEVCNMYTSERLMLVLVWHDHIQTRMTGLTTATTIPCALKSDTYGLTFGTKHFKSLNASSITASADPRLWSSGECLRNEISGIPNPIEFGLIFAGGVLRATRRPVQCHAIGILAALCLSLDRFAEDFLLHHLVFDTPNQLRILDSHTLSSPPPEELVTWCSRLPQLEALPALFDCQQRNSAGPGPQEAGSRRPTVKKRPASISAVKHQARANEAHDGCMSLSLRLGWRAR